MDSSILAKRALKPMFQRVSVRTGRGSDYGWIYISLEVSRPESCFCKFPIKQPEDYCEKCRWVERVAQSRAREQLQHVPFDEYTDDMGYVERKYLINVHVK